MYILAWIIGIIIGMALFFVLVFSGISSIWSYQCNNYGTNTNHEVKYSFWAAQCYVKTSSGWFTTDQINQNNVSKP